MFLLLLEMNGCRLGDLIPGGKNTKAPLTDEELQPDPHRPPSAIARLIAAVSSATPSPTAP
jgi:hypothetical protein